MSLITFINLNYLIIIIISRINNFNLKIFGFIKPLYKIKIKNINLLIIIRVIRILDFYFILRNNKYNLFNNLYFI